MFRGLQRTFSRTSFLSARNLCAQASASSASPEVKELVDKVCAMNLMQVKEFTDLLKVKLDIPDFAGGPMMMAAAPAAGTGDEDEEAPVAEVKTKFNVKLTDFDKIIKIKLIKEIRGIADIGLKEAKELVDSVPSDILKDVDKKKADAAIEALRALGASVELE